MGRPTKHDQSIDAIMEWFELGNIGSVQQVADAFNIDRDLAFQAVRRLSRNGMIGMVNRTILPNSRGKVCVVWGECEFTIKHKPVNVSEVITNQPEIVRVWNKVVA